MTGSEVKIDVEKLDVLARGAELYSSGVNASALRAMRDWTVETLTLHPAGMLPVEACKDGNNYAVVSIVGSAAALAEDLPDGREISHAAEAFERVAARRIDGVVALNMAGENALLAVKAAAVLGVPVIDGDGCGRVFPLLEQTVFALHGIPAGPFALAMPGAETITVDVAHHRTEAYARACVAAAGGWGIFFGYALSGRQLKESAVPGTMGGLLELGGGAVPHALGRRPRRICRGAVTALEYSRAAQRPTPEGITIPSDAVSILLRENGGRSRLFRLEARNEIFFALAEGTPVAAPPDQLLLIDEDGRAVDIERLVVGLRVDFVVIEAPPAWHTDSGRALASLGSPVILQNPGRTHA